jgi:hypothetical protein
MVNTQGVMAVLDHHIGINWDDGPTLLRIGAQVRYRFGAFGGLNTLRVNASARSSDEPLCFETHNHDIRATWTWRELSDGFSAQLSVSNAGDEPLLLEAVDILRIDAVFGGQLNLGAPATLWRIARAGKGMPRWEVLRSGETNFNSPGGALIQPVASNRSAPPCLHLRRLPGEGPAVLISVVTQQESFQCFTAGCMLNNQPLAAGVAQSFPEVWIVCGDDARELAGL